jgi:hypothetical protein
MNLTCEYEPFFVLLIDPISFIKSGNLVYDMYSIQKRYYRERKILRVEILQKRKKVSLCWQFREWMVGT